MIQEYTAREISPYNISGWSKSPKIHGKVVDRGLATMYFTPQVDSKRHTALFVEHGYWRAVIWHCCFPNVTRGIHNSLTQAWAFPNPTPVTVPVTKMNFGRYGYCVLYVPEVCVPKEFSRNFTSSRPGSTMDRERFVPADWNRCRSDTQYILISTVELCYVNSSEVNYSCMYI